LWEWELRADWAEWVDLLVFPVVPLLAVSWEDVEISSFDVWCCSLVLRDDDDGAGVTVAGMGVEEAVEVPLV